MPLESLILISSLTFKRRRHVKEKLWAVREVGGIEMSIS